MSSNSGEIQVIAKKRSMDNVCFDDLDEEFEENVKRIATEINKLTQVTQEACKFLDFFFGYFIPYNKRFALEYPDYLMGRIRSKLRTATQRRLDREKRTDVEEDRMNNVNVRVESECLSCSYLIAISLCNTIPYIVCTGVYGFDAPVESIQRGCCRHCKCPRGTRIPCPVAPMCETCFCSACRASPWLIDTYDNMAAIENDQNWFFLTDEKFKLAMEGVVDSTELPDTLARLTLSYLIAPHLEPEFSSNKTMTSSSSSSSLDVNSDPLSEEEHKTVYKKGEEMVRGFVKDCMKANIAIGRAMDQDGSIWVCEGVVEMRLFYGHGPVTIHALHTFRLKAEAILFARAMQKIEKDAMKIELDAFIKQQNERVSSSSSSVAAPVFPSLRVKVEVKQVQELPKALPEDVDLLVQLDDRGEYGIDMYWKGRHTSGQSWCRGSSFSIYNPEAGCFIDLAAHEIKKIVMEPHFQDFRAESVQELLNDLNKSAETALYKENVLSAISTDHDVFETYCFHPKETSEAIERTWTDKTVAFILDGGDSSVMCFIHKLDEVEKELLALIDVVERHDVTQNWI